MRVPKSTLVVPKLTERNIKNFNSKYAKDDNGCWIWQGGVRGDGYGSFHINYKTYPAHRVSFAHHKGYTPVGKDLDHLCRVPACVNPDHLEPVTVKENVMRGLLPSLTKKRFEEMTHCKHGHKLTKDNLYVYKQTGRQGNVYARRECKKCVDTRNMKNYYRKRLAVEVEEMLV